MVLPFLASFAQVMPGDQQEAAAQAEMFEKRIGAS
jgi:hypothetical protein